MLYFLSRVMDLLLFWRSKGSKTRIPNWLKGYQYSLSVSEQNAANKVISYAKKHKLDSADMKSIFKFELEYEAKFLKGNGGAKSDLFRLIEAYIKISFLKHCDQHL
jgi:hypothetical protein